MSMRFLPLLLILFTLGLQAQSERFNDFRATITLDTAGDVTVTERIAVTAAGGWLRWVVGGRPTAASVCKPLQAASR
jgi:hypothetical protein